jgi:hypothetical protein
MTTTVSSLTARFQPDRRTLAYGALLVNTELLWLLAYAFGRGVVPNDLFYVYPFVWINVGLWALWKTTPAPASDRRRWLAGGLAGGYFLVLAYVGGTFGLTGPPAGVPATGFRVAVESLPPGFGPALLYQGESLRLALLPFKLVGYLALAYLVYATVLDAAESAAVGLLGLFSCVSCTWPVIATVVTGVAGSGSALATAALQQSYGASTVVFVVTVGLLYWRPTVR